MRRFGFAAVLAAFGVVTLAATANAVPSFVRQTGLTCNQCHITFSNVPDFTFTGKKFRLNGYRAPYVAEKIEAGEEGALNGRRLIMGIQNIFSLRFRNTLLSQSKSSSQVGSPTSAGALSTTPGSSISWFYVGAIGEHIGLWNEFYLDLAGGGTGNSVFRITSFDEYDVKFVMNPGYDNIIGLAWTTQALDCVAGFCPFGAGAYGSNMQRGGIGNAHTPYVNFMAYTMLKDRFLLVAGVQPGEDNRSFQGHNYMGLFGVALGNSDYNQLWYYTQVKVGNDAIPIVTSTGLDADRNITYNTNSNIRATRGETGATQVAYRAADLGDTFRNEHEVTYGFVDRGPHSLIAGVGLGYSKDTYADGASATQMGLGARVRYYYNRTWGFEYNKSFRFKNEFVDKNGVLHQFSNVPFNPFSGTLFYRPAMNFSVSLGWGFLTKGGGNFFETPSAGDLDTRQYKRDGWNWNLGIDYMF